MPEPCTRAARARAGEVPGPAPWSTSAPAGADVRASSDPGDAPAARHRHREGHEGHPEPVTTQSAAASTTRRRDPERPGRVAAEPTAVARIHDGLGRPATQARAPPVARGGTRVTSCHRATTP